MFRAVLALALSAALASPAAFAMPLARSASPDASVIKAYGGCGPYGHRGPWGGCRRGGQWGGYRRVAPRLVRVCPPGFHLGPAGRRCWPN